MNGLTWLHISDWHQGDEDYDRGHLSERLMEDIGRCMDEHPELAKIDFIVFSGDLANSGLADEYEQAVDQLFLPLMKATRMDATRFWSSLLIVPGNHDVERRVIDESKEEELRDPLGKFRTPMEKRAALNNDLLKDPRKLMRLLSPFNNFRNFIRRRVWSGSTDELIKREPCYFQIRHLEKDGRRVGFVGFNSALLSRGSASDYGRLAIGERPLGEALREIRDDHIRIAVMHHPLSWLADFDRDYVEERLFGSCHFVLHGHQHLPRVHVVRSTIGDAVNIPAGTIYNRRFPPNTRYTNSYNFAHIDFESRRGTVYMRRWGEREDSWVEDDAYRPEGHRPVGRFSFLLPKSVDPSKREVYYTQASSLVGKIGERFCESYSVRVKGTVHAEGDVRVVRQEVSQRVTLCPGAPEMFTAEIVVSGNNRVVSPCEATLAGVRQDDAWWLKLNNHPLDTFTAEGNKIVYTAQLDGREAVIEYRYVLNMGIDDFFIVLLKRFTKHFILYVEKDRNLIYEFIKLGGIPVKHPQQPFLGPVDKAETYETRIGELCRPEQGMLIQWYRK